MSVFQNSNKYFKYNRAGHWADCPSSTVNTLKGGLGSLLPYDSSEKDTNSSTSFMGMLSNLGKCFRCHQLGHWARDCPFLVGISRGGEPPLSFANSNSEKDVSATNTIGLNAKGEGPVSFAISDSIEKESETMSTAHSANDVNSTMNMTVLPNEDKCFKCFQHHSSNGSNDGVGEAVSSSSCGIFEKDVSSSSSSNSMPSKSDKYFKCQQPGHWVKDCPSRDSNSRGQPNSLSCGNIPQKNCIRCKGSCVMFTSNTANNPGRKFYKCLECGFFEWCDGQTSPSKVNSPPESVGQQQFPSPSNSNGGCRRIVKGYDLSTQCPCGAGPCPVRTAKTQKNMGRQFVCCPVRKGEGSCGFFKWYEELDSAASFVFSDTSGK